MGGSAKARAESVDVIWDGVLKENDLGIDGNAIAFWNGKQKIDGWLGLNECMSWDIECVVISLREPLSPIEEASKGVSSSNARQISLSNKLVISFNELEVWLQFDHL